MLDNYFFLSGVNKLKITVKITAPIIVHKILKLFPLISIIKGSGNANSRESHEPIIAPIKPTIIEIIHPPRLNPDNDRAIEPAIPAINRDIRMSTIL